MIAKRHYHAALAIFTVFFVLFIFRRGLLAQTTGPRGVGESAQRYLEHLKGIGQNPAQNSTLGFQKIFVLSLPDRADRRKPLLAAAKTTKIDLTIFDAVRGDDVPVEERPPAFNDTSGWDNFSGTLGCLMSHMGAMKRMVKENIASALILESDVDWDVRIKDSMPMLAEGIKQIANVPALPPPRRAGDKISSEISLEPYGNSWDFLWLGHCGATLNEGYGRIFSYEDAAVPFRQHEWAFAGHPTDEQHPLNDTRLVFEHSDATCTYGIAVSLKGAVKMIDWLSNATRGPVDFEYNDACKLNPNLNCVTVYPSLFGSWNSPSSINSHEGESAELEMEEHEVGAHKVPVIKGFSLGVRYSARKNTPLVMSGFSQEDWIS